MNAVVPHSSCILKSGKCENAEVESFLKRLNNGIFFEFLFAEYLRNFNLFNKDEIRESYWHFPNLENRIPTIKARAFLISDWPESDSAWKHYWWSFLWAVEIQRRRI